MDKRLVSQKRIAMCSNAAFGCADELNVDSFGRQRYARRCAKGPLGIHLARNQLAIVKASVDFTDSDVILGKDHVKDVSGNVTVKESDALVAQLVKPGDSRGFESYDASKICVPSEKGDSDNWRAPPEIPIRGQTKSSIGNIPVDRRRRY